MREISVVVSASSRAETAAMWDEFRTAGLVFIGLGLAGGTMWA